ncbi:SEL1-like repeat protein [Chromobacterium sp. CV08]|uniref:SEL1-like repeat protein n=1 Tax=Chromobacterium sp. CV08 TaxID=3133274 RepID=UPI003DA8AEB6
MLTIRKGFEITVLLILLSACGKPEKRLPTLDEVKVNRAFACVYEKKNLPQLSPEADQLYRYARYVQKNNLLKEDISVYPELERLFRIATAHNHYKANLELRQMIGKGHAWSADPVKETLDLTEELIRQGVPGGYYDMARYIEAGYGVKQDPELALRYYRKSADLGSPDGQSWVAEKLAPLDHAPEVARQMRHCAADQGSGSAADSLGRDYKGDKAYPEAVKIFHTGVKNGNETSAAELEAAFSGPDASDTFNYLGLLKDVERADRYKKIADVLGRYSYLHPTVPELDEIVPLPPAKLPPWDGKIQWQKNHEANVAPPKPSEELIAKLAKAKNLDPKTGRPVGADHS